MRQRARAKKCLIQSLGGTRKSPKSVHSCRIVPRPTVAIVNKPTHLLLTTAPRERPVRVSQPHQRSENGSCLSSLQNPVQRKMVSAVKKTSGESRRMCRDWVMRAFSNMMRKEARRDVVARQSRPRRVRYARGTVAIPRIAGTMRIATYGVFSYVLKSTSDGWDRQGWAFALKLCKNLLCNLRKIKVSIKPRDESPKRDKEFGQWRVNIHEISRLDVSRGKLAKVNFVESGLFECSRMISSPGRTLTQEGEGLRTQHCRVLIYGTTAPPTR